MAATRRKYPGRSLHRAGVVLALFVAAAIVGLVSGRAGDETPDAAPMSHLVDDPWIPAVRRSLPVPPRELCNPEVGDCDSPERPHASWMGAAMRPIRDAVCRIGKVGPPPSGSTDDVLSEGIRRGVILFADNHAIDLYSIIFLEMAKRLLELSSSQGRQLVLVLEAVKMRDAALMPSALPLTSVESDGLATNGRHSASRYRMLIVDDGLRGARLMPGGPTGDLRRYLEEFLKNSPNPPAPMVDHHRELRRRMDEVIGSLRRPVFLVMFGMDHMCGPSSLSETLRVYDQPPVVVYPFIPELESRLVQSYGSEFADRWVWLDHDLVRCPALSQVRCPRREPERPSASGAGR
jgi:hypothetical protein